MKIELPIGKLAEYIEEYKNITLLNNEEVQISDLNVSVPTPSGSKANINFFIKKTDLEMIELCLSNGYKVQVAKKHILRQNNQDIFAEDIKIGDTLDHISDDVMVLNVKEISNQDCFDIGIDAPHLYADANGLIHHNTLMTAALSKSVEHLGRSIVIVPNKSLVVQTEEDYVNLGLDVGVYFGDKKEYGKTHTICTWQSLNSLIKGVQEGTVDNDLAEFFFDGIVCVIVDEVHMAKADVLKQLLTGVFANVPIRWGLTGTIPKEKMDQVSLLVSLGPVIGKLSASELQDRGVLAQCHVNIMQLKDEKEFTNYQSELKFLLEDDDRLEKIASLIEDIANTGNTLILVDRVNAGKEIANKIDGAVFVSGATGLTERKEEYDDIAISDNKVLVCTYGIAAVGINIPRIFNLVLIEPGKSFVRVIQSIGRGIRKAEDKDFVQIWDITSTCKFSKRHLTHRKQYYREANYPFTLKKLDY